MEKRNVKNFILAAVFVAAFVLWTVAVKLVDVQAIGPMESSVGFAELNKMFHDLTGVHMWLYTLTDWLGFVPIAFVLGFALLGLVQLIKRKNPLKVDYSILVLGGFYVAVMAAYGVFEVIPVNYRPVLIRGYLEASYPSSTTMLVLCVMPTAMMQLGERIKNRTLKRCVRSGIAAFTVFMVLGRLVSVVHWLTDIIGGVLSSGGLVMMYRAVRSLRK